MQDISPWSIKQKEYLETFLSDPARPPGTLNFSKLDGFARAVNLVPEFQSLFNWSTLVFAQQNPNFKGIEESKEYFDSLSSLSNHHVDEIYSDKCTFAMDCVYSKSAAKRQQIEDWCHGFLLGFAIFAEIWWDFIDLYPEPEINSPLQLEPLEEQIESILYIVETVADSEAAIKTATDPKDLEGIFETLEESITLFGLISQALIKANDDATIAEEAYEELLGYEPQILPFERQTVKTGRNNPCPCGSGKKFKKCCLH